MGMGNSVKILYLHRSLGRGGDGVHIDEMIRAFRKLGASVVDGSLVRRQASAALFSPERGGVIKALWGRPAVKESVHISYNLLAWRRLRAIIEEQRPDFLYERYGVFSYVGVKLAKEKRLPHILEVNLPYARYLAEQDALVFRSLAGKIERKVFATTDQIIMASEYIGEVIEEMGLSTEKTTFMPNAVNPETFHPDVDPGDLRAHLGLTDKIVVGFIGFAKEDHDLDLLLRAVPEIRREVPEAVFLLVGAGEYMPVLRARAAAMHLDDWVLFPGPVPHGDVPRYIAAMDIPISLSSSPLGLTLKMFEYMAMGKPTVLTDWPSVRKVVQDGRDALLVEDGNVSQLKEAIVRLARDPSLRAQLGRNARERVLSDYTWEANARKVLEIFEEMRWPSRSSW